MTQIPKLDRITFKGRANYYIAGEKVLFKSMDPTVSLIEAIVVDVNVVLGNDKPQYRYDISIPSTMSMVEETGKTVIVPAEPSTLAVDEKDLFKLHKPSTDTFDEIKAKS